MPRKLLTGSVFSVTGREMNNVAVISPVYALQSRVPGLMVTATGSMGLGTRTSLRGAGLPLYVVDGVPLNAMDLKENLDILQLLPTSDIVSVEVLKDASATAIYGVQGENGVVLITTRQGQSGKPALQFDNYVGLQQRRSPLSGESHTSFLQNYGLGVRGGSQKFHYHVSGNLFNAPSVDQSTFYVPYLTRYSLRANLQAQPVKGLTIGANWMLSRISQGIERADQTDYRTGKQWLGNVFAQYEFLPGLSLRINYGLNQFNQHADGQQPAYYYEGKTAMRHYERNSNNTYELAEAILSYRYQLNDLHSLDVVVGGSLQHLTQKSEETSRVGNTVIDQGGFNLGDNFPNQSSQWFRFERGMPSVFSRINYAFRDRYLLTLTARQDGFESVSSPLLNYFMPAIGIGWRLSEESFMQNAGAVEELKLRASYGQSNVSQSNQWNLGLDLGLWKNRVLFTADYYNGKRRFLAPIPVPPYIGGGEILGGGSISNQGVEFSLQTRNTTGKLQWDTQLTLGHNLTIVGSISRLTPGEGIGSFYGYITLPSNTGNSGYQTDLGDMNPKWFGGFSNSFRNGRFSAELLMQLSMGGKVMITRYTSGQRPDYELKSRSFLQMRNLMLGYDLSSGRWNWMKRAQVYMGLQNLFTVSEVADSDAITLGSPRERVVLVGLRVGL
jgi:TonB-dependent SusC/RagA subfamily outer membrane receptor